MKDSKQLQTEAEFKAELAALLAKYHATIEADDHYRGYAECGEDIRISINGEGGFGKETLEQTFPYLDLNLGRYVTPEGLHEKA